MKENNFKERIFTDNNAQIIYEINALVNALTHNVDYYMRDEKATSEELTELCKQIATNFLKRIK